MADPTCPHCKGHSFALETISPKGSNFQMCLIYCAQCGAPAGITESQNVSTNVFLAENRIKTAVATLVGPIEARLAELERAVQQIADRSEG